MHEMHDYAEGEEETGREKREGERERERGGVCRSRLMPVLHLLLPLLLFSSDRSVVVNSHSLRR